MRDAATWTGRRGTVLLGPTEARVARWLAGRTRHGRVAIRTVDLARSTRVERSEAYRITARLRVLGLFGVEDDRGGTRGGRRYWRTAIPFDVGELDATRHRDAWRRIVAWSIARARAVAARLDHLRSRSMLHVDRTSDPYPTTARALVVVQGRVGIGPEPAERKPPGSGRSILERLELAGLAPGLVERFAGR